MRPPCRHDLLALLLGLVLAQFVFVSADQYQQVIITFDTVQDCTQDMFPSQWWSIIEDGLNEVGIRPMEWTHGYEIQEGGHRHMQSNAGCPDWCRFLTQYCECLCVSNCDSGQDDDDDDNTSNNNAAESTASPISNSNSNSNSNTNSNTNTNTNSNTNNNNPSTGRTPGRQSSNGGRQNLRRLEESSWLNAHRRVPEAQFVLDEETVKSYIENELQSNQLEIPCMIPQDGIRVYVITSND